MSSSRSPGAVLRVSRMRAGAAAAAIWAVSVAMPLIRCMKLSTMRSATRMLSAAASGARVRGDRAVCCVFETPRTRLCRQNTAQPQLQRVRRKRRARGETR